MTILVFVLGLFFGGLLGSLAMALAIAAGDTKREEHAYWAGFRNGMEPRR
jgi:hypothetical protein